MQRPELKTRFIYGILQAAGGHYHIAVCLWIQYEERTTTIDTEMSQKYGTRSSVVVFVLLYLVFSLNNVEILAPIDGICPECAARDLLAIPTMA